LSYVIQNFYDSNRKIALSPRFKFFYIFKNINKFFIFIKLNSFFKFNHLYNIFNINYFNPFFKHFFTKSYIKLIYNTNLTLLGNYTNNLTKSFIFLIFFNFINFFKNKNIIFINQFFNPSKFFFNSYIIPIKAINIKLSKFFYKNLFFYFLITISFIWYQHTSNLNFYLSFFFINYNLKTFRFFNNHFLRIYNF